LAVNLVNGQAVKNVGSGSTDKMLLIHIMDVQNEAALWSKVFHQNAMPEWLVWDAYPERGTRNSIQKPAPKWKKHRNWHQKVYKCPLCDTRTLKKG